MVTHLVSHTRIPHNVRQLTAPVWRSSGRDARPFYLYRQPQQAHAMTTDSLTPEAVQVMLDTMASMQEAHNLHVHPDWRTQRYEYYRAIWVECAEMLDHYGWKWWKKQDADIDQVKLELVDIWHFGLSDLLRAQTLDASVGQTLAGISAVSEPDPERFRQAIEALALNTLQNQAFALAPFAAAMGSLPMDYEELFSMYVGKNVLNNFRQDHGYKQGTYQKVWHGREDNEHLIDVMNEQPLGEDLPQRLYAALQARYPG